MTEQEQERLSALVDKELPHNEITGEIGKLLKNSPGHEVWSRYHLIGDAIRQEVGPVVDLQLADRISKRVQDEPVVLAPHAMQHPTAKWLKPTSGLAIAASVALLAVAVTPRLLNHEPANESLNVIATNQTTKQSTKERIYVADDGTRWELLSKPKVESRLNSYLVNHQEYAPAGNLKGIMPYATFVSYDGGQ
ncbi:MAG: sigma-E factor negative regulatory protein [Pseudomonadota bacterium]